MLGRPPSSTPKIRLATMMRQRLPGEVADRVAALGLDRQRLEQHERQAAGSPARMTRRAPTAESSPRRPDAARRSAHAVVGGARGEGDADDDEHQTRPEVALALDFHGASSPRALEAADSRQRPSSAPMSGLHRARPVRRSRATPRPGVARSTSSSVVTPSATFIAPARRSGRRPSCSAWLPQLAYVAAPAGSWLRAASLTVSSSIQAGAAAISRSCGTRGSRPACTAARRR